MTEIHTEGLPMFTPLPPEGLSVSTGEVWAPRGAELKAQALAQHEATRAHDIQKVRVALLAGARMAHSDTLTADDAAVVVERLGLNTGNWLGSIFRHWPAVQHTGQYVKSTLPRSRARMISLWRIV